MMRLVLVRAAVLVLTTGAELAAQAAPRPLTLASQNAAHPHEFTTITSLRELADGRIIVTDGREQQLLLLNFVTGEEAQIGRRGGGPGEYGMVGFVYATAGDSSIMTDLMARRWVLFAGDSIVHSVAPDNRAVVATPFAAIYGADVRGRVLGRGTIDRGDGRFETGREDSTYVVLIDRASGRADTITRTLNAPRTIEQRRNAQGTIVQSSSMARGVLQSEEQAILLPDGTVAVARIEPFRVDWLSPEGRWTRGAALPIARIRVDARERDAYIARNRPTTMPPGMQAPLPPEASMFPDFIPVFPQGASVLAGPGGTILIRRTKSADFTGNNYFVIDRTRGLIGEIALPITQAIVGAGPKSLYVTNRDADDILRLTRHPWPNR